MLGCRHGLGVRGRFSGRTGQHHAVGLGGLGCRDNLAGISEMRLASATGRSNRNEDSYHPNLLTTDITALYITNASGNAATFYLECVYDPTP